MSLTVGAIGYLSASGWRLWRASRTGWDLFDALSYSLFGVVTLALTVALGTYGTRSLVTLGALTIAAGWMSARVFFKDTFNISGPR